MRVVVHRHDLYRLLEHHIPLAQVLQGAADWEAALHGHGGGGRPRGERRGKTRPPQAVAGGTSDASPRRFHFPRRLTGGASRRAARVLPSSLELVVLAGGALRRGLVHLRFRAPST